MKLDFNVLLASVALRLGEEIAAQLPACAAAMLDCAPFEVTEIEDDDCGELLLRAALAEPEGFRRLELSCCRALVVLPQQTVVLSPEEALFHPLLLGWAGADLAAAIAAPIVSGSRLHRLAAGAPAFGVVNLHRQGEGLAGSAGMIFDNLPLKPGVVSHYGPSAPDSEPTVTLCGDALFGVGRDARLGWVVQDDPQAGSQGSAFTIH